MFLSSVRRTIPQELHSTYLLSRENMEYLRPQLGMMNAHIGYVYLVDEYLRIRWAGCADAMEEEAKALQTATGVLLGRLGKRGKVGQSKSP
jgi:mitochondrial ATPase complex subunit ATP10